MTRRSLSIVYINILLLKEVLGLYKYKYKYKFGLVERGLQIVQGR